MHRPFLLLLTLLVGILALACSGAADTDSPTEAYKRLYTAVKSKDPAAIKAEMSKKSQEFAESLAVRQKNPVEKVYENGFTGTTFSPTLPEIRDERVSGVWGGVEVWNEKENRWEDLPFVNEDGKWKFAIGELFGGSYQSPGKSRDTLDKEAANVARGGGPINTIRMDNLNTANTSSNTAPYNGPQVEPLPKKR